MFSAWGLWFRVYYTHGPGLQFADATACSTHTHEHNYAQLLATSLFPFLHVLLFCGCSRLLTNEHFFVARIPEQEVLTQVRNQDLEDAPHFSLASLPMHADNTHTDTHTHTCMRDFIYLCVCIHTHTHKPEINENKCSRDASWSICTESLKAISEFPNPIPTTPKNKVEGIQKTHSETKSSSRLHLRAPAPLRVCHQDPAGDDAVAPIRLSVTAPTPACVFPYDST